MRSHRFLAFAVAAGLPACFPTWPDPGLDCSHTSCPLGDSSSAEPPASTSGGLPTTSAAAPETTTLATTGDSVAPSTSTTATTSDPDAPINQPPTIDEFTADTANINAAGAIALTLAASDDHAIVAAHLYLDDMLVADIPPGPFPTQYDYPVLSAKQNGKSREFRLAVEDAEGLVAEKTLLVAITLPDTGSERCIFEAPDKGTTTSIVSALAYTKDAIWAVGSRDPGAGLRITVWKLNPDDCQLLPGWPKSLVNWTADDTLLSLVSAGAAVTIDELENIVVAGNFLISAKPQSYVVLLTPAGSRLWEHTGAPGDEVAGVAAGIGQYNDRVFVGGSQRTSENPVRTDGAVWIYDADGSSVFVGPPIILRAPFTPDEYDQDMLNKYNEWVRAILVDPTTGNVLAVGERELKLADDVQPRYSRAFAVELQPTGVLLGTPWTSSAPVFRHDAARSVSRCDDTIVLGGWTRDHVDPDATPQPLIFQLGSMGYRHFAQLGATQINGIACDQENKLILAATKVSAPTDAQVFSLTETFDPPIWYDKGVTGDDGASAVACDSRGFCGWGGYRTKAGKPYAVVRVHNP